MGFEYTPIYEPFDLGEIDPRFAGQSLNILRNPTRKFRREYWTLDAAGTEKAIAFILGLDVDAANEILDSLDGFITRALFVMTMVGDEVIQAHVVKLWDRYSDAQVKKLSAPSAPLQLNTPSD
jgi:hypothetical protein